MANPQKMKYLVKNDTENDYYEKHTALPLTEQATMLMNPDGIFLKRYANYKASHISIYPDAFSWANDDNYNGHEPICYDPLITAQSLVFKYASGLEVSTRTFVHLPAFNGTDINVEVPLHVRDGVMPGTREKIRLSLTATLILPGETIIDALSDPSRNNTFIVEYTFVNNNEMGLVNIPVKLHNNDDYLTTDSIIVFKLTRICDDKIPFLLTNIYVPYINVQYDFGEI